MFHGYLDTIFNVSFNRKLFGCICNCVASKIIVWRDCYTILLRLSAIFPVIFFFTIVLFEILAP